MSTISGDVVQHPNAGGGGPPPALADRDAVKAFDDVLLAQTSPQAQEPSPETDTRNASSSEAATEAAEIIQDLRGVGYNPEEPEDLGSRPDAFRGPYMDPNRGASERLRQKITGGTDPRVPQLAVDPAALGEFQDAVRTAYYEGKLSTADLTDFVSAYTEVGADFAGRDDFNQIGIDTILGTGDTGLIKNVALELYGRASRNDPALDSGANETHRSDHYALAFRALKSVADEGDTSVSARILHDLSQSDDSLRLAVAGALDASAPGALNFLVGQTTSRAEAGILETDLADEVIQTILQSSRGGALLEQDTDARDDIIKYVLDDFDRIVGESIFPLSGTDSGSFPDRELNDDAFLEDIVAALVLNPGVKRDTAQKFADKFGETLKTALATSKDLIADLGERKEAARTIGFVQTAYDEGLERAEASQEDYAGALAILVGAGFDFIPGLDVPNRILKGRIDDALAQLQSDTSEGATGLLGELLGSELEERDGVLRKSIDPGISAVLTDPNEEGVDLLNAIEIYESFEGGEDSAEDARKDLPED